MEMILLIFSFCIFEVSSQHYKKRDEKPCYHATTVTAGANGNDQRHGIFLGKE